MKKTLSVLLAALFLFSLTSSALAEEGAGGRIFLHYTTAAAAVQGKIPPEPTCSRRFRRPGLHICPSIC